MDLMRELSGNPIYRRERRRTGNLDVLLWLVSMPAIVSSLFSAPFLLLFSPGGGGSAEDLVAFPLIIGFAVVCINIAFLPGCAAACLSGERASGIGVSLLLTPYPRSGILFGKLARRLAPFAAQTGACMANILLVAVALWPSAHSPMDWLMMLGLGLGLPLASFTLTVGLSTYLGLWAPARAAGVGLAYAATVLAGVLLPIGLWLLAVLIHRAGEFVTVSLVALALLVLPTAIGWYFFQRAADGLDDYLAGEEA